MAFGGVPLGFHEEFGVSMHGYAASPMFPAGQQPGKLTRRIHVWCMDIYPHLGLIFIASKYVIYHPMGNILENPSWMDRHISSWKGWFSNRIQIPLFLMFTLPNFPLRAHVFQTDGFNHLPKPSCAVLPDCKDGDSTCDSLVQLLFDFDLFLWPVIGLQMGLYYSDRSINGGFKLGFHIYIGYSLIPP